MASVVFSRPEAAEEATRTAVRNARLMGRHSAAPVALAPVEPVVDTVRPRLPEDPRAVSLEEKLAP